MGFQSGRSGGIGTGRIALNPQNCQKVTRKMVLDAAQKRGIKIKREGQGMWSHFRELENTWYNLGQTNFLAWHRMINEEFK
jgi:hypothetical protein